MEYKDKRSHKLAYHKDRVLQWYKNGDCIPIYVEMGLTNICNHQCVFCGFDQERGKDVLETGVALRNLRDMGEYGVKSVCFSGAGEPLLHKDFSRIVRGARESGLDVAFSTNAVLFNGEKAKETLPYTTWIRFSVDAANPEMHAKIHGTSTRDFPRIVENLNSAVQVKKREGYDTVLGVQFLLLDENYKELIEFIKTCRSIGVDKVQIKPYSHHSTSHNQFNVDYRKFDNIESELESLATKDFEIQLRIKRQEILNGKKSYSVCRSLPFWAIINERGEVVPCHIFYSKPDFVYGNIYQDNFSKIWESQKRKEIIKKTYSIGADSCNRLGCRGDSMNEFLDGLIAGRIPIEEVTGPNGDIPRHVNFI